MIDEVSELDEPYISGFKVTGFRTIVDSTVLCDGPLTVVCGPNNAGKSSLLEALLRYPACLRTACDPPRQSRKGALFEDTRVRAEVAIPILDGPISRRWEKLGNRIELFKSAAEAFCERLGDNRIWLAVISGPEGVKTDFQSARSTVQHALTGYPDHDPFMEVMHSLDGQRRNPFAATDEFFKALAQDIHKPEVVHISDVRRAIDQPLTNEELGKLARASNLRTDGSRQEPWTETLALILKDTFGPDVEYHVPPNGASGNFQLNIDGDRDIDLSHVGAGIREVVAILYKALSTGPRTVLLLEEPENCLHPMAVRRLLRSLVSRAQLQVIVSTHSTAVIDSNPTSLIKVNRTPEGTSTVPIEDASSRYEAIRSLGYSPADVVLAPCAIWVEGPSDRIYITSWLTQHGLTEGIDYQIMFYGGALGAHVSAASDEPPDQLTAIRPLARRCVIIADSDRKAPDDSLKIHVQRWQDELKEDRDAYLWTTPGREVENLLPLEAINVFRSTKRLRKMQEAERQFGNVFAGISRPDKVGLARLVVAQSPSAPSDGAEAVDKIASFIRDSRDRVTTD